ncbi:MAG: hypothetical protein ABIJ09_08065 [Pseudomonadota bacterium]
MGVRKTGQTTTPQVRSQDTPILRDPTQTAALDQGQVRLSPEQLKQKTGLGETAQVASNFATGNEQAGQVAKKQTGVLSLLQNKSPAPEGQIRKAEANLRAAVDRDEGVTLDTAKQLQRDVKDLPVDAQAKLAQRALDSGQLEPGAYKLLKELAGPDAPASVGAAQNSATGTSGASQARMSEALRDSMWNQDARSLQLAVEGKHEGPSEEVIQNILERAGPENFERLAREYKKETGRELRYAVAEKLSPGNWQKANASVGGQLGPQLKGSPAEVLHDAMKGLGTDEERAYDALSRVGPEGFDGTAREYQQRFGRDLRKDLGKELTVKEWDQANALVGGKLGPEHPELAKLRELAKTPDRIGKAIEEKGDKLFGGDWWRKPRALID